MDFSIVPNDSLGIITKSELDVAISTAKSFPRDIKRFIEKTIHDATITQAVAEKCQYSLPRRDKNGNQTSLEGPSVHFARICCANYQNIKVAARIISNDGKWITAQGVAIDMENNYTVSVEVKRKITDRNGNPFSEDLQTMVANAANAIAFRNACFNIIPSAYTSEILEAVREVAKGTVKDLVTRRTNCIKWFLSQGITERQVLDLAGVLELDQIGLEELLVLTNIRESLKSGEQTIHTLFQNDDPGILPEQKRETMAVNAQSNYENPVEPNQPLFTNEQNAANDESTSKTGKTTGNPKK